MSCVTGDVVDANTMSWVPFHCRGCICIMSWMTCSPRHDSCTHDVIPTICTHEEAMSWVSVSCRGCVRCMSCVTGDVVDAKYHIVGVI